ncbi:MAG: TlyA family RNA methyltransferase [Patescibacteria group bacterium]|nr:TlyA family RNA methyltransferase [Patescibacteria group bacterium]
MPSQPFASRAGLKLAHALQAFSVSPEGKICIDLGCSTGGFTDVLIQNNAKKVYAVDTGYGVLDWKLRQNPKVIVCEKQNAMYFKPPELADLITIDTSWTMQEKILPAALEMLKPDGLIITLVKPHYEAKLAYVNLEQAQDILKKTIEKIQTSNKLFLQDQIESPIRGKHGGNPEFLFLLSKSN